MTNTTTTATTFRNRLSCEILELTSEGAGMLTFRRVWSCEELDNAEGTIEMDHRVAALVLEPFTA